MSDSRRQYRAIKSGLLQLYPQRLTGGWCSEWRCWPCLLPAAHPVILLGDGEFDSLELQHAVKQQGWHYVFRTAKDTWVCCENECS